MIGQKNSSDDLILIDSHCHLHDKEFFNDNQRQVMYQRAIDQKIGMICVGTDVKTSGQAVEFTKNRSNTWAVIGIHPHDAKNGGVAEIRHLLELKSPKIVGIGEIGLDYFYDNSDRVVQQKILREQLALAQESNLPISFHIRDEKTASGAVWRDFWPIFDEFSGLRGVLHSFTDTQENLDAGFQRGLFVGLNGISTFTKDEKQIELYKNIPLDKILFETDAPFLTPKPFRGTINEPSYVRLVAEHWAEQRNIDFAALAKIATNNTRQIFGI